MEKQEKKNPLVEYNRKNMSMFGILFSLYLKSDFATCASMTLCMFPNLFDSVSLSVKRG